MTKFAIILAAAAVAASAQTKPAFEVATVKPAAPLDMAKMMSALQAGQPPKIGARVDAGRAEYTYMSLRDLTALAYNVRPYQVTGPDWISSQRFDILAKIPDGAPKADTPKMLQSLLEDRFKLTVHRSTAEHPVLALVIGKGGLKLKESGTPPPIDENAPLKPGEVAMDNGDGPSRMTLNRDGGGAMNMGSRGVVTFRTDPATRTMHLDATMITLAGLADMLTQFSQMMGGGALQFVDMTGLNGHYQVALDFSPSDRAAMVRSMGLDMQAPESDPGGTSLLAAVQALGLKLESRKATVEQLIVDHMERVPTEN